jgi:serine/threonine protein kinase
MSEVKEDDSRPSSKSAEVPFAVGDMIDGRYRLQRDLGRGAAGQVFEAVHTFMGRKVALKFVGVDVSPKMRRELHTRLEREARALAAVRHPSVVGVLDGGVLPDGTPYLVMELLEGRTLEGIIAARGCTTADDAISIGIQLASALEAVHAAGVLHRDIKPANIVIVTEPPHREVAKILDFGVARIDGETADKLTSVGALIGTPNYMPPEQLLGQGDLDVRSDVYALGATLFECLTGRVPYDGTYPNVLLEVCSSKPPVDVEAQGVAVPAALAEVVRRAMAKDRAARFASMTDLGNALRSCLVTSRAQTLTHFFELPTGRAAEPRVTVEQRKLVRAPYATPVRLVVGELTLDARSDDISTGGVLLVARESCPVDRLGTLRFALPMDGSMVTVKVQVRWSRAANGGASGPRAIGVEFLSPPPDIVASIARYVELMNLPERK